MDAQLWRGLALLRALALLWSVAQFAYIASGGDYDHAGRGWAVLAAMAVWTAVITRVERRPEGRTTGWLLTDLAVSCLLLVAAGTAHSDPYLVAERSLPVLWASVAALSLAVARGLLAGLASVALIVVMEVAVRGSVTATVASNAVLLAVTAVVLWWVASISREADRQRAAAARLQAQEAERRRLGRVVHDGVLQVLAQVARRGPELGPDGQALARAAAEQEVALRALVASDVPTASDTYPDGDTELGSALCELASSDVTVSPPAGPVPVPAESARELLDAVRAALDNVQRHAPGAHAWVLLEDEVDQVRVTVRDDGPGFGPGRLEQARSEGRLGVAESIRGRVADLGGAATIVSAPGSGVVVELVVPRGAA